MNDISALYLYLICLHLFLAFGVYQVRQDKVTKKWAGYFSVGLIIMAVQYSLQWYHHGNGGRLYNTAQALLSVLNNPFFLAGALTLLDRTNQSGGRRKLSSNYLFLFILGATACIAFGILFLPGEARQVLYFSVAAVSILVYIVEAVAYFRVLDFFRHDFLRFLPIMTAVLLSVLEVIYALDWQEKRLYYVSIPLRFLFFVSPLLMLTLRMPQDFGLKKFIAGATQRREFILSERLVESIGGLIKAQQVMLLMKKPDFHLGEPKRLIEQFGGYAWEEGAAESAAPLSLEAALERTTREEREFLGEVCPRNRDERPGWRPRLYRRSEDGFETIILPIEVYGGVIGALFVRLHAGVKTRAIFVEKLRFATLALLPLVQGSRQMAAVGMLNERFARNLIAGGRTGGSADERPKLAVTEGVDEILRSILDTLSPVAVALKPSRHFNSVEHFNSADSILLRSHDKYFPHEQRAAFIEKYFGPVPDDKPLGDIRPLRLETDFGRLIMFVGAESDYPDRPMMGAHPVVLDVLKEMTNSALKSILSRNLRMILKDADEELGEGVGKPADEEHVVRAFQRYVKHFGVSWVVVVFDGARFYGYEEKFACVRQWLHACKADGKIRAENLDADGWLVRSCWPLESPARNDGRTEFQVSFWFGVEEPEFRLETWEDIFYQFIRFGLTKVKDLRMQNLLERWNIEQDIRLQELARFCWFVGNEARLITFGAKDEASAPERSAQFRKLTLLADELNEAGDLLIRLVQENSPPTARLALQEVIQEAWDGLNPAGRNRGELLFQGDCRAKVVAAKDDLLFLFSRLLNWLTSASEEGPDGGGRVAVHCRLDGLQVEISLENGGVRMPRALRESMFVPMAQPIDYNQSLQDRGPNLFLAIYLANTILKKRYKGNLDDLSDNLPGETGHKLVVTMPILN